MSSAWITVIAIAIALFLANATLAYRYRSRKLRSLGQEPPPFLKYLFFPRPLPQRVPIPRPVRLILGLLFLAGGAFFVLIAALPFIPSARSHSDPLILGLVVLACGSIGAAIGYTGFRLVVVKNDEPLFKWLREDKRS